MRHYLISYERRGRLELVRDDNQLKLTLVRIKLHPNDNQLKLTLVRIKLHPNDNQLKLTLVRIKLHPNDNQLKLTLVRIKLHPNLTHYVMIRIPCQNHKKKRRVLTTTRKFNEMEKKRLCNE